MKHWRIYVIIFNCRMLKNCAGQIYMTIFHCFHVEKFAMKNLYDDFQLFWCSKTRQDKSMTSNWRQIKDESMRHQILYDNFLLFSCLWQICMTILHCFRVEKFARTNLYDSYQYEFAMTNLCDDFKEFSCWKILYDKSIWQFSTVFMFKNWGQIYVIIFNCFHVSKISMINLYDNFQLFWCLKIV